MSPGMGLGVMGSTTVASSATSPWTNMPAGAVVIKETIWSFPIPTGSSDQLCASDPTSPKWRTIFNNNQTNSGGATTTDGSAPLDSGAIFQETFASGFTGGSAADTLYFDHTGYKHVYFGYYAFWPTGWQPNSPSGVSKSLFWFTNTNGFSMDVQMYGTGTSSYELDVCTEFPSLVRFRPASPTLITLNTYHKIEVELNYTGIINAWLDGVQQIGVSNATFPSDSGFDEPHVSPTWGGTDDTVTSTQVHNYNHMIFAQAA